MRDKQQTKHVKQRLRYVYTQEKGLNRGKIYETNKPNKIEIRIRVSRQMPACADRGLCTQDLTCVRMLMTCLNEIVKKPYLKNTKEKNRAEIKTLILTTKHAQNINRTVKLT